MLMQMGNQTFFIDMDSRCVLFCKSLLESGTLGSKGNVQVRIKKKKRHYEFCTTDQHLK